MYIDTVNLSLKKTYGTLSDLTGDHTLFSFCQLRSSLPPCQWVEHMTQREESARPLVQLASFTIYTYTCIYIYIYAYPNP